MLDLRRALHILTLGMAIQLPRDLDARVRAAVRHFWDMRSTQAQKQRQSGSVDHGARSAVTGGAQMNGFIDLFADLALWAGARPENILRGSQAMLPGLFRPSRQWDLLVKREEQVVCAYEFASVTGLATEEELDRRTDEAIASAHDLWGVYGRHAINFDIQPWLGYVLVAATEDGLRPASRTRARINDVLPEFRQATSVHRYELLCSRLVRERLYSDAALLLVKKDGTYAGPADDLSLAHLCRVLVSRVTYVVAA